MCGIAGLLCLDRALSFTAIRDVAQMTQSMRQRGPDDEGFLQVSADYKTTSLYGAETSPDAISSDSLGLGLPATSLQSRSETASRLVLGHRRLSIIDLTRTGHQPMCTSDQRYWIVFNGEIYNFPQIREELIANGSRLIGQSDTEILVNSYALWKEHCLDRLNGDFAIAIWDNDLKELFLARDRLGVKPLYYTQINNQLLFGSDIKSIISSGLYTAQPNPEGLYFAMGFGVAPRPITAFKNIYSVKQGHWMRFQVNGSQEEGCYWKIPVGTQDHSMSLTDAANLLESELSAAIDRRLLSDVPLGTFMSGGLDSTTLSAIASKLKPNIKAFTLNFSDNQNRSEEIRSAIATAKLHPIDHVIKNIDISDVLKHIPEMVACYEEPFHNLSPNFIISKLVKDAGIKVILNGLGGDELLAGYWYYNLAILCKQLPRILRHLKDIFAFFPTNITRRLSTVLDLKHPADLHTSLSMCTTDTDLHKLFVPQELKCIDTVSAIRNLYASDLYFEDIIEATSYMDLKNYVSNHHLYRIDEFTMANSIEGRFPFLDHNVVAACFTIPTKHKIRFSQQKIVLKQLAAKHIARSSFSMKKKGFSLPLAEWLQGPLCEIAYNKTERLKERDLINGDSISYWQKEFRSGKLSPTRFWHLAALELWFERFIDGEAAV